MAEIAGVVILGILAQWIAWRTRVPAILPLILIGLCIGPLWQYNYGHKLINPVFDITTGEGLFPGQSLFHFVELAIGIILFEGGLTLRRKEIEGVGPAILRLITVGSIVTFVGAGLSAHFILGLNWNIAFLFAGLIIVTGPTVIAPILRNIPLTKNTATVLKWEGILIDPIGALVAVLVYEFILAGLAGETAHFTQDVFIDFGRILVAGLAIGFGFAWSLYQGIKKDWIPHYLLNVLTLAAVMLAFVLSNTIAHDSGLFTVVVMGMVLGNLDVPNIKGILDFKESLTVLLISILFILLSANINVEQILLINREAFILFGVVVFVLRPVGVFLSTTATSLSFREKLFISWVGPRGIVAAGIASLFGIKLSGMDVPGAEMLTPLVFLIVLGTVLLNATTARPIARWLGVTLDSSDGFLIIGANNAARVIAQFIQQQNYHVVLVDRSQSAIEKAQELGLEAIEGDIFSEDFSERYELLDVGYLLALTSNDRVNEVACQRFEPTFGENGTYRLVANEEMDKPSGSLDDMVLFDNTDDFIRLSEVIRDYPQPNIVDLESEEQFEDILKQLRIIHKSIPLMILRKNGKIEMVVANKDNHDIEKGDKLIYVGEALAINTAETTEELKA